MIIVANIPFALAVLSARNVKLQVHGKAREVLTLDEHGN